MKSPLKSPAALLTPGRALTFANVAEGAEDWSSPISHAPSPQNQNRRR